MHLLLGACQSGHILECNLGTLVLLHQFGTALAHIEEAHGATAASSAACSAQHEHPEEDDKYEGTKGPQDVAKHVVTLLIGHFTLEVACLLLLVQEGVQLVGRGEFGFHKNLCARLYRTGGEHIAHMLGTHIHAERTVTLVGHNARSVSLAHISLELAVCHLLVRRREQRRTAAPDYQEAQQESNAQIDPHEIEMRFGCFVIIHKVYCLRE